MSVRGAVRAVARTLLVVVLLVAALGAAEVALRIAGLGGGGLLEYDPTRGWRLTAGVTGRVEGQGPVELRINDDGLRGPETSALKPGGTLRIAVIGGTTTEAPRIPYDKTFCAIVESEMAGCASTNGQPVEVLDFGVEGYDLTQDLLTLRDQVWRFQPDIVVLAVNTARDFGSRPAAPDGDRSASQRCRPRATLPNGALELTYDFRDSVGLRNECETAFELRSLRLPRFLAGGASQIYRLIVGHAPDDQDQKSGAPAPASQIYGPPGSPKARLDWDVGEALISAMARDATQHQTRFIVVTLTNPVQVYPYPELRQQALKESGSEDIFYPERRLRKLGDREGFPVIALAPEMQSYADEYRTYLHGGSLEAAGVGEWNAAGHLLGGEIIARDICTLIGNKFAIPAPMPPTRGGPAGEPTAARTAAPALSAIPAPTRAPSANASQAPLPKLTPTPSPAPTRAIPPPPPLSLSIAPASTPAAVTAPRPVRTATPYPTPTPLPPLAPTSTHILTPMGESTPVRTPIPPTRATPLSTLAPPPIGSPSASPRPSQLPSSLPTTAENPALPFPPTIVSQSPIAVSPKRPAAPAATASAAGPVRGTPIPRMTAQAVGVPPVPKPSATPTTGASPAITSVPVPTPWALQAPIAAVAKSPTPTPLPTATNAPPAPSVVMTPRPSAAPIPPSPTPRESRRRQHHWHHRSHDQDEYYNIE